MMGRSFDKIRIVVVQPEEMIYFDKYYDDVIVAFDKFNYFCKLANINYDESPEFVMDKSDRYNEMTIYFPKNEINERNQSGFVQVSIYFEVKL